MNIISRLIIIIKQHKWLLLPIIPMAIFPLITFLALFSENLQEDQTTRTPTASPVPSFSSYLSEYDHGSEIEKPLEEMPGFQKKEIKSDGTTIYSYTSSNPSRPNILITQGEEIIFDRHIIPPEYPVTISEATQVYGQPEHIIQNSSTYGQNTSIYIYATLGITFIVNPSTNQVLEQHVFYPMSVDEYIKNYGESLVPNTTP